MTLCIAAILMGENSIALVSDQLVSNGFTSAEGFHKDYLLEWGRWVALCTAKEARRVPMLMEAMKNHLHAVDGFIGKQEIIKAYQDAHREQIALMCGARLSKIGFTSLDDFLQRGYDILRDVIFENILNELNQLDLGITLLIAGFDATAEPTLLEASNGEVFVPPLGFHAIGEGAWIAEAILNQLPSRWLYEDAESNLYRLCSAKFAAEKMQSGSVGKDTTVVLIHHDGKHSVMWEDDVLGLRDIWESHLLDRPPNRAVEWIKAKMRLMDF